MLRVAQDVNHVPPSRILRLPWVVEWGEEDALLVMAYDEYKLRMCPCGCGFWESECTNPDNAKKFVVDEKTFYARAALEQWQKDHESPEPGVQPALRLISADMSPEEYARAEIAAMRARHNLN